MKLSLIDLLEGEKEASYLKSLNQGALKKELGKQKPPPNVDKKSYYQQLFAGLDQKAEEGPIFNKQIIEYFRSLNVELSKNEIQWLANSIKNSKLPPPTLFRELNDETLLSIIQWIRNNNVDIGKVDLYSALHKAGETDNMPHQNPKGNVEMDFGDGFTIVELTDDEDLKQEGQLMGHCAGTYCDIVRAGESRVFSLRDPKGRPHATMEINPKTEQIEQVQGKGNKPPVSRYWKYIYAFIQKHEPESRLLDDFIPNEQFYEDFYPLWEQSPEKVLDGMLSSAFARPNYGKYTKEFLDGVYSRLYQQTYGIEDFIEKLLEKLDKEPLLYVMNLLDEKDKSRFYFKEGLGDKELMYSVLSNGNLPPKEFDRISFHFFKNQESFYGARKLISQIIIPNLHKVSGKSLKVYYDWLDEQVYEQDSRMQKETEDMLNALRDRMKKNGLMENLFRSLFNLI